jgi:hypothetical protein
MHCFDVGVERLLFSKGLVTRRVSGAIELGLMHLFMSLQPTVGSKGLAAALPVAYMVSRGLGMVVG